MLSPKRNQLWAQWQGRPQTKIFPVPINLCRISFERFGYFTTPPKALHVVFPSPSFQNRRYVSFHMVVPWICIAISKSQVICRKAKNAVFSIFWWYSAKKIQVAANRTISKLDALPIAHFEADVPDFSKHMLKLAIPLKFWVPAQSEVGWSRIVILKKAVFRPFFGRKSLFWPILTQ